MERAFKQIAKFERLLAAQSAQETAAGWRQLNEPIPALLQQPFLSLQGQIGTNPLPGAESLNPDDGILAGLFNNLPDFGAQLLPEGAPELTTLGLSVGDAEPSFDYYGNGKYFSSCTLSVFTPEGMISVYFSASEKALTLSASKWALGMEGTSGYSRSSSVWMTESADGSTTFSGKLTDRYIDPFTGATRGIWAEVSTNDGPGGLFGNGTAKFGFGLEERDHHAHFQLTRNPEAGIRIVGDGWFRNPAAGLSGSFSGLWSQNSLMFDADLTKSFGRNGSVTADFRRDAAGESYGANLNYNLYDADGDDNPANDVLRLRLAAGVRHQADGANLFLGEAVLPLVGTANFRHTLQATASGLPGLEQPFRFDKSEITPSPEFGMLLKMQAQMEWNQAIEGKVGLETHLGPLGLGVGVQTEGRFGHMMLTPTLRAVLDF